MEWVGSLREARIAPAPTFPVTATPRIACRRTLGR